MKKRKFGNIGWDVSEISLGCWAMGADWGDVSEENAKNILKTSFDNGVNFFDTADVYGDGRSKKNLSVNLSIQLLSEYMLLQKQVEEFFHTKHKDIMIKS